MRISAPAPPLTGHVNFSEPDLFEVRIYKDEGGMRLVAAIELVGRRVVSAASRRLGTRPPARGREVYVCSP